MVQFLKVFFSRRFGTKRSLDDAVLERILSKDAATLREADPETNLQWLRLQRRLSTRLPESSSRRMRLVPRLALGIPFVAATVVVSYMYFTPRAYAPETFATHKGEQKQLVLHDNSEVTLNYASHLTVARMENGKARLLSLVGEAFFRVRRNETPFIVSTTYADVHVVGTEFNVRARDGMLEVAVIRGIVNVQSAKHPDHNPLVLTQGQRAICTRDGLPQLGDNVPSPQYPGWLHGTLFFDKTTFAEACREIEMRFDVAIKIDDRDIQNELVTGMLNAKNAESAMTALCGLARKRFQYDGKAYIIF